MADFVHPVNDVFLPGGRLCEDALTESAAFAFHEAVRFARQTCWESVRSPHLFMGLLSTGDEAVKNWGERLGVDLDELQQQFQTMFHQPGEAEPYLNLTREFFSDNLIRILREAQNRARDGERSQITPMDLLITLLTASNSIVAECFEQYFRKFGITAAKLTELAVLAEQQHNDPGVPPS